ncbi:hypothetical protein KKA15_06080 [Patescibacteria group bacterium]|nr:hypothetical protein [Patescibacteria group bacterium]
MLRSISKNFVKYWLKICVKLFIWRHKPQIIAVTGTTNKYAVKDEIYNVLKEKYNVRTSPRNFNSDIGVPLSVLNLPVGYHYFTKWVIILLKALAKPFFSKSIPEIIVLELAIDKPKDMDYLLTLIKPKIAVVTNISEQHLESFEGLDNIAHEYLKLAKSVGSNDLVILNADDPRLKDVKDIKAKVWYYGIENECEFRALDVKENESGEGFRFDNTEVKINKFGKHYIYAKLASLAVKKFYDSVVVP